MADRPWEIEINEDTPDDKLELCALSADRSSDTNIQRKASEAKVELKRRDRAYEKEQWAHRFNIESQERIHAQRFQENQRLETQEFQEAQTARQLEIANKTLRVTYVAAAAAALSAIAAIALVYLIAINSVE